MNANQLRRLAGRVATVVAEMNEAQRRMTELRLSLDRYLPSPHKAPDTYSEFLARTSGPLPHEPCARERDHGQRGCRW